MKLGQPLALGFEALGLAQQLAKLLVHRDQPIPLGKSRSAMAFNANARSVSISSGSESAGRPARVSCHKLPGGATKTAQAASGLIA
jgi:hypothetical protein